MSIYLHLPIPKVAPSYIVKMIKGITARKIFPKVSPHKEISMEGIKTIGSISEEAIRKYIEAQKKE